MDQQIFSWLYNLANKNQLLDWFLIFLAEYLIFILVFIAVIIILKEKDWRRRFYFSSLAIISVILSRGIITFLIRFYYERPRPFVATDITPLINHAATGSFPSGHIAFIFPLVLVIWLVNRRAGIWFTVGALLIGLARVAIGIHWPSDILGGIAIGSLSFLAVYYFLKLKGVSSRSLSIPKTASRSDIPVGLG